VRRLLWFSAGFAAALVAVFACAAVYFLGPAQTPGRDAVVLIRPGMTLPAIASELQARGLIRNAQTLLLLARLQRAPASAKAGEFLLSSGWTPGEILRVITSTSGIQHRVVVREGLPWWSAARLFEAQGLTDQQGFAKAMRNATLLQKYAIPAASAEGFLFPETYQLPRAQADNATIVVETMLKEFDRQAKKLWPQGPPPAPELLRIVTLASLVERETVDKDELEALLEGRWDEFLAGEAARKAAAEEEEKAATRKSRRERKKGSEEAEAGATEEPPSEPPATPDGRPILEVPELEGTS